ncbi:Iron-sulfur cluster assembly accessory protein [Xenococcus sp. PCC 7305]|uniref:HesB/IscA family protein n=1 Tax=Xenococcus sp. PCC 7305 TaxID=102125 RepID=UPI0002AC100D|nr:iron-sulfur cluster assembly accessory protein [Xenococcus sp. PCC 7305]ELS04775.1 Iron-sulfur cluster assembly accessory protein [Xenococcus sp. PCC 7305]
MIHISKNAAQEIKRIQLSHQKPDSIFRLTVKEGGCSGLFYVFQLDESLPKENSSSAEPQLQFESNGVSIVVDQKSYTYLEGIKLDYSEDLMGGGFRFQNPNVSSSCGCGISFSPSTPEDQ